MKAIILNFNRNVCKIFNIVPVYHIDSVLFVVYTYLMYSNLKKREIERNKIAVLVYNMYCI